ncbi:MAG: AI-2E family transporter [Lachnospiraceae bacterium]|nr:AI-2E family transporter [Lachnospiraceae bacterium]
MDEEPHIVKNGFAVWGSAYFVLSEVQEEEKLKWRIEQKYLKIGCIALVVLILSISFWHFLEHETKLDDFKTVVSGTMGPIIMGILLAYLLNPILNFYERYLFTPLAGFLFKGEDKDKKRQGFSRGMGILFTMVLFLLLVIGGLYLVIPQVYLSLGNIVKEAPNFYNSVEQWMRSLDKEHMEISRYMLAGWDKLYLQAITYLNEDILPNMDKIVASITSGIVVGLKAILNVILAIIISVYVMLEKEILISVAKKLTFSMFSRANANRILRGVRYADQVFGGFVNGKLIDSFIIGMLCYLFMMAAGFEYPVLISIIVGATNVIPYFGPFIGAIPSVLILLMQDAGTGLVFAIFIVVLQQVDGNIIGPVILGDRLKISSMWILFAILIGGGFFGIVGMILGAPCFACIYALVSTMCESKLMKKGLPVHTEDYLNIDRAMLDGDGVILKSNVQPSKLHKSKKELHRTAHHRSKTDGVEEHADMISDRETAEASRHKDVHVEADGGDITSSDREHNAEQPDKMHSAESTEEVYSGQENEEGYSADTSKEE